LAGGKVLLAVEQNDNAVATYRLNFPDTPIFHGDICKLSVDECCKQAGIVSGELDVLDGSPPCQGFSTAGKRVFGDSRNDLFKEFARLLRGLQPKAFIMENVSGMVKGKMRLTFAECLKELKESGYRVKARLLDAMYFNVPQSRKRMIFIGTREDLQIEPTHPKAQSMPRTVRQAIGHLPLGTPGNHQPQVIEAWYKSKPGQSLRKADQFVGSFQSCRLSPDKPSSTQIKTHRNWHFSVPRQLNNLEMSIIGGFPPGFKWHGNKGDVCNRIGNSVPPPFMQAIAGHVASLIAGKTAEVQHG